MPQEYAPTSASVQAPARSHREDGISHVVYMLGSALAHRDYDRFGIEAMKGRSIRVTMLDVSEICHPGSDQPRDHYPEFGDLELRTCFTPADLDQELTTLQEADLILCLFSEGTINWNNAPLLRLINRSKTPYALNCCSAIPGIRNYKGEIRFLHKRVQDIFARLKSIDWRTSIISRLPIRFLGITPARFVLHGGRMSRQPRPLITSATQVISAHTLDYDIFLRDKSTKANATANAVFLDQGLDHHPNLIMFKEYSAIDVEGYFKSLQTLFERIEQELGLSVVIAAHPRSDYHDRPGVFGGRKIIYGETQRLIRECSLAITFTSLSINFAILHRKPVLILSTRDFYKFPAGRRYQDPMSKELGKPILFLEDVEKANLSDVLDVGGARYDQYLENYVKQSGSPDIPFWDIALDQINKTLFLPSKNMN